MGVADVGSLGLPSLPPWNPHCPPTRELDRTNLVENTSIWAMNLRTLNPKPEVIVIYKSATCPLALASRQGALQILIAMSLSCHKRPLSPELLGGSWVVTSRVISTINKVRTKYMFSYPNYITPP